MAAAEGDASPVDIFHIEAGDPSAPVLLLIHGWPTSSIDWFAVISQLSRRFRVCALDFPGYGFSDKPLGWGYSLERDEELIEFYLSEVVGAETGVVVAHDRGDSVALLHAARCAEGRSATRLEHLVLSNGNIFLPMSNLTRAQRRILDPETGSQLAAALTPARLAEAMGASTFTPPRQPGDPDVEALTATFGHDNGTRVVHETIQYLAERSKDEQTWLKALAEAPFPVTVIWGLYDTVSPPRVASYVWNEYLMLRPGGNHLYFIPDANHYLQVDRPDAFVKVLLHTLEPGDDQAPGALGAELGSPLLVDSSRERLPAAADLLHAGAPAGTNGGPSGPDAPGRPAPPEHSPSFQRVTPISRGRSFQRGPRPPAWLPGPHPGHGRQREHRRAGPRASDRPVRQPRRHLSTTGQSAGHGIACVLCRCPEACRCGGTQPD